jgi:hypothetical protein
MKFPSAQGEPRTIAEVFMPWMNVYGSVKQAIQDLIAPEIQLLHAESKGSMPKSKE